jgi:transcription antitermination factor NusB
MMLCECELNPPDSLDVALSAFWEMQADLERDSIADGEYGVREAVTIDGRKHMASLVEMKDFAEQRIKGVLGGVAELDAALEPFLKNWEFYRLGTVERNVLRLGAWELANCPDVPAPIVINEAVDLAKFFPESQSGKFVNGVLDSYAKKLAGKPFNP